MKFKEYLDWLNTIAESNPQALEVEVVFNNGEEFEKVDGLSARVGNFDEKKGNFDQVNNWGMFPFNSICINYRRLIMASKQVKKRWARDSALARAWTPEIQRLFGQKYYGFVNSLDHYPFKVCNNEIFYHIISSGRTEEEAIKGAKTLLKIFYPEELWPYMEDEINAEPDLDN